MNRLIVSILILVLSIISAATAQEQTDLSSGTVKIPEGVTVVVIRKSNNEHITIEGTEKAAQLPVERYAIDHWTIERRDEEGSNWTLTGKDLGSKGLFSIVQAKETSLLVGEPIILEMTATKTGSSYYFRLFLVGQLSETIGIEKNKAQPEPPKMHVKNADGSYQETLSFKYG